MELGHRLVGDNSDARARSDFRDLLAGSCEKTVADKNVVAAGAERDAHVSYAGSVSRAGETGRERVDDRSTTASCGPSCDSMVMSASA